MYAIVKKSDNKYYTSMVFGYYKKKSESGRYLKNLFDRCFIVLNEEKNKLVIQYIFDRNKEYLDPLILITDADRKNWNINDDNCGSVKFLDSENLLTLVENNNVPETDLIKCIENDKNYKYSEYVNAENEQDFENFSCVSGGLHDAYIEKLKEENDSIYVLFEGVWGCSIEVWFEGNVSYNLGDKKEENFCFWLNSTLTKYNGYIYLIDQSEANPDNISEDSCWFRAEKMKYHVILS